MLTKRIIPCLDVKDGRVVKGKSFIELRDAGDPVELADFYYKEGAGVPEDLYQALALGKADAVLVASIFHYRTYSVAETKEYLEKRKIPIRI